MLRPLTSTPEPRGAQDAIQLLQLHGPSLAEEAGDLCQQHPEIQPVGLVLAPDAPAAFEIGRLLEQITKVDLHGKGFIGLVPRSVAVSILRVTAPAALEWLPPQSDGSERTLPLVALMRDGCRVGGIDYRVRG
jgi:hypothetical protein